MARLNTLLFLIVVALSVVALIDCLLTDRSRLRAFPRGAWVVLVLLCPIAGPIAWFRAGRATSAADVHVTPAPRGPIGPDDDPEFVRMLAESIRNR
ncbi:PLD nuclease N-terminal domain-containing protein [Actinoplanes sp. GCM10030250]|uniref:PLD nuclease N-terminal domain-containing protein n=1 Tax=Actinoplanes sp. GCM10030250 TaxID=3273376 RepID=UPI00361F83AA